MHKKIKNRILVVDDDENMRILYRKFLETSGYEVFEAESGEEGVKKAADLLPDLILLDFNMPGITGLETCKRLSANPILHDVIILFVSSEDSIELKISCIEAGGFDFINKPVDPGILLSKIKRYLASEFDKEKELEEKKNEVLKQAANTLFHYINNPLTVISGFTELAIKSIEQNRSSEEVRKRLLVIQQETKRIEEIIKSFSRAVKVVVEEITPGIKMIDLKKSDKNC